MRVLLVNDCAPGLHGSGGVEIHLRQLKEALGEHGIDAAILANQTRGFPERCEKDLCLISELNAPPLRKHFLRNRHQQQVALEKAAAFIRQFKPDVIHVHNLMNPHVLRLLLKSGPVVKSFHDCRPFCVKPPPLVAARMIGDTDEFCDITFGLRCWNCCYAHAGRIGLERIGAWACFPPNLKMLKDVLKCDRVVTYGSYLKELILRKFSDETRVHVIYHFSDAEQASDNIPQHSPPNEPVFLFTGRLAREKGPLHIFQALERIPEIACKVIIAGDGPLRAEVDRRSRICHPAHRVEVVGFVDQAQLYELYRQSSVLIFPSIGSEGCPLVGIEAMYFGVPAIGYENGGASEWLVDGRTGIQVPRGDVAGLARAMAELASDPERTARLGAQARAYVCQKFQREKHISQLIDVYQQALRDKGAVLHENR